MSVEVCVCPLTSSLNLSLSSGVRWPAWNRATVASHSSAPPPPPLANHSPAQWSPGRSWTPRTLGPLNPHSQPYPPTPLPTTLKPALLVFGLCTYCTASLHGTEACLHKQKTKNKRKKQRLHLKGWFLHKGHIFHAWRHCLALVRVTTLAECWFVLCPVHSGKVNVRASFTALESERSNILVLGATGPDKDTGVTVTFTHLRFHSRKQYCGHAFLLHVRWLKRLDVLLHSQNHHRWTFDDMQKFTACATPLPGGRGQSGELFIG